MVKEEIDKFIPEPVAIYPLSSSQPYNDRSERQNNIAVNVSTTFE